ncbi:MAG TPA: sigma factor [Thermoanaerobaculia bacterium]|jgi:DNA-directed RNA polymerase specialized sigma24 family protein
MRDDTGIGGSADRFPETRSSAVLAAQSPDLLERERGLAILVETYWKPAYKYLRLRFGASNEDAKDLTQGFFARAIEKDFFDGYDPARGSFRTYLRTCLDRFAANERKAANRQKRSPGAALLSLDFDGAETELRREPASAERGAEDYFHDEFVRSLLALSIEKLREECLLRGKDLPYRLFERYELDRDGDQTISYDRLAEEFQIPVTQVTNFLAFARREFRRIVLEKLREITANDREFREEARSLLGVSS